MKKYVQGILLDVGCGSSNYRQYCLEATQIRQYWGVDYPAWQNNLMKGDALTSASGFVKVLYRHRPARPDVWGDGCELGIRDGSIDTVLSFGVLEHIEKYEAYIRECIRVLRDGGCMIMTIPFLYQAHGGDDARDDFVRWTRWGIEKALVSKGLSIVEIRPFGGVGTMLSQLMNSYLIKRLNLYNGRLLVFKMALGAGLSLLFLAGNVICLGLDALDSDHHYACGFHVVARKA